MTTAPGTTVTSAGASASSGDSDTITSAPPADGSTSLLLQTVTLPNGARSTLTSVAVAGGGAEGVGGPTPAGGAGPSGTATGSLQSQGAAPGTRALLGWEMVGALGGAVGVAMVL